MVGTFSTPIAVVAAAVLSDINNFSAFAGLEIKNMLSVFLCHAVNIVRSLANHLQGIHTLIADEVAQVAKLVASMSILSL